MKRFAALLCTLILLLGMSPAVFAAASTKPTEHEIPEVSLKVTIPSDCYVFTQKTSPYSGDFAKVGITNGMQKLQEYQKYGILMEVVSADKKTTMSIGKKENSQTAQIYNLKQAEKNQVKKLLDSCRQDIKKDNVTVHSEANIYEHKQVPFIRLDQQGDVNKTKVWETCYMTIINGYSVSFDMHSSAPLTKNQQKWLKGIVDSVTFTKLLKAPSPQEKRDQVILFVVPIVVLIVGILAIVFGMRAYRKSCDLKRRELADRLANYRMEQKEREEEAQAKGEVLPEPAVVVENTTLCSDDALAGFATFHIYKKRLISTLVIFFMGVISVICAVCFKDSSIMRVILAALGIFLIAQPVWMRKKLLKMEMGFYKQCRTKEAHYVFREDDFRITGVQSATLYPYFQIVNVYETKRYFYLYYSTERAYLVDKKTFSPEELETFRKLIKEKVSYGYHGK